MGEGKLEKWAKQKAKNLAVAAGHKVADVARGAVAPKTIKNSGGVNGTPCTPADMERDAHQVKINRVNALYNEIVNLLQDIKDEGGVRKGALLVKKFTGRCHVSYKLDSTYSHQGSVLEAHCDRDTPATCRYLGGKLAGGLRKGGMVTQVLRDEKTILLVLGNLPR